MKLKKILTMVLLMSSVMSHVAYANEKTWEQLPGHHNQSILLPVDEINAEDVLDANNSARGIRLSTAVLNISNEENGSLHVSVNTLVHQSVDRIYQVVFLDEWDESKEDWVQIGSWNFERTKEEEEDGELTSYHVGFFVDNCVLNHYYRARAMHLVEWGDLMEGKATETNGVLLTDHEI